MEGSDARNRTGLAAAGVVALVAVLVVLAALLDLGPFGDDSPAGFAAAGDEICEAAHERFEELQDSTPRTAEDAAELVGELLDVAEQEREEIAALDAPADVQPELERYLHARDRGIELLREGLEAAEADDPQAYEQLQARLSSGQAERHRLARDVGFTECSRPLSGPGA